MWSSPIHPGESWYLIGIPKGVLVDDVVLSDAPDASGTDGEAEATYSEFDVASPQVGSTISRRSIGW